MTEINQQADLARDIIETTNRNLFLTGKAGTGKTTFLRRLRRELPKRMVVLAPTGIAAINAEGVTLHSFFQLPFSPYLPGVPNTEKRYGINKQKQKLIRSLDLLVIDEISMVRADMLDAVDSELRRIRRDSHPFGGLQVLFIGDLHQLSPVVKDEEWAMLSQYYATPYFFSAQVLEKAEMLCVELEQVYRQSDPQFLSLLNDLREGKATNGTLQMLNERYVENFDVNNSDWGIQLVTHNWQAQRINDSKLEQIDAKAYTYCAQIKGKFPELSFPTEKDLVLKVGAQVMFVKNDAQKRYYNGTIAKVVEANEQNFKVKTVDDGRIITVIEEAWNNSRYGIDEKDGEIREIVEGTFKQFPIKLAWAITIHKSQGLTFDHVVIDAAKAFTHGQTYVALSRCRTLQGIVLTSQLTEGAIIVDEVVRSFYQKVHDMQITSGQLALMRMDYHLRLVEELFTFEKERIGFSQLHRLFEEHLYRIYPQTAASIESNLREFDLAVMSVSSKFHAQYQYLLKLAKGSIEDDVLQERISKGAFYFKEKLNQVLQFVSDSSDVDVDNKEVKKRLNTIGADLIETLTEHISLLKWVHANGLHLKDYLKARARVLMQKDKKSAEGAKATKDKTAVDGSSHAKTKLPSEVKNPKLYAVLHNWRYEKSKELEKPAYTILQTNAIIGMANMMPQTKEELLNIPYFGEKGFERYGSELLQIIKDFANNL